MPQAAERRVHDCSRRRARAQRRASGHATTTADWCAEARGEPACGKRWRQLRQKSGLRRILSQPVCCYGTSARLMRYGWSTRQDPGRTFRRRTDPTQIALARAQFLDVFPHAFTVPRFTRSRASGKQLPAPCRRSWLATRAIRITAGRVRQVTGFLLWMSWLYRQLETESRLTLMAVPNRRPTYVSDNSPGSRCRRARGGVLG